MSKSSEPPLTPRPAGTVMLVRDGRAGLEVFLMRRRSSMEFAPGMIVFPGGGVDDRDRDSGIAWWGPEPTWWAQRFGVDTGLAAALVCSAVRETFEESGVLFAGPADDPHDVVADASVYSDARRALASGELSFADFLRDEKLVLHADLLRPWANWVTPEAERTRRYDTYFFVAALPVGQRADGDNTESDLAGWATPEAAIDDFAAGRTILLPPTWTQLDSLAGRSVADVLAVQRQIVSVKPGSFIDDDNNWVFEFFDADRYNELLQHRPGGFP
ncbi:MAG TPA: NUDIX hydrolase [Mycobacterium sp.]|nr:NUDIX hydrolase [Mycobacterium sp.]